MPSYGGPGHFEISSGHLVAIYQHGMHILRLAYCFLFYHFNLTNKSIANLLFWIKHICMFLYFL